jgi:hypothetical protein
VSPPAVRMPMRFMGNEKGRVHYGTRVPDD